jgi:hypothetical protein
MALDSHVGGLAKPIQIFLSCVMVARCGVLSWGRAFLAHYLHFRCLSSFFQIRQEKEPDEL